MTPEFQIGDDVWIALFDTVEEYVPCPDCGGHRSLKVTTFDGAEYVIACDTCRIGYDPPTGRCRVWKRKPHVRAGVVIGVEQAGDRFKYRIQADDRSYYFEVGRVSYTSDGAKAAAKALAERTDREERARLLLKEKPERSWAWHVCYYRREIRDARARIAHAERSLGIAIPEARAEKKRKKS